MAKTLAGRASPTPFRRNAFAPSDLKKRIQSVLRRVHEPGQLELRLPSESKRIEQGAPWCRGYHERGKQLLERITNKKLTPTVHTSEIFMILSQSCCRVR